MSESNTTLEIRCSFCAKSEPSVSLLINAPGDNICEECVDECSELIDKNDFKDNSIAETSCSFCSKTKKIINKTTMISEGYICEECIELCKEIIEERRWKKEGFAFCSFFCRKTADQVPLIVMGPKENICSNCVRMCNSFLDSKKTKGESFRVGTCVFCGDKSNEAELVGICELICSKCLDKHIEVIQKREELKNHSQTIQF